MMIEGKHNLSNPEYVRIILEKALSILDREKAEAMPSFQLANEIVSELRLPSGEAMLVMNAIAPRMAVSAKRENVIFLLETLKTENGTTKQNAIQTSTPTEEAKDSRQLLKRDILVEIENLSIVPFSFLEKRYGQRAQALGIKLDSFLNTHFALSEMVFSSQTQVAAKRGFDCTWNSFARLLLEENSHQPFSINVLADRIGIAPDEAKSRLKKRQIGGLLLWTEYDVWSIDDVQITDQVKRRIRLCLDQHGDVPILLDDLFNNIFVGVIAMNYYSEVFVEAKTRCIDKAFGEMNIHEYTYEKETKRYKKKTIKAEGKYPYKMF